MERSYLLVRRQSRPVQGMLPKRKVSHPKRVLLALRNRHSKRGTNYPRNWRLFGKSRINPLTHHPQPRKTHIMQAIETKVIPATNTKPTRIKATCERGSIIVSADSLSGDQMNGSEFTHVRAAQILVDRFCAEDAKQYGSDPKTNPWNAKRVTGGTKEGYAHVFIK